MFEAVIREMPGSLHAVGSTISNANRAAAERAKLHAIVDGQGRLRRVLITDGQLHKGQGALRR